MLHQALTIANKDITRRVPADLFLAHKKINKRNGAVTKFLVHLIYFHHRKQTNQTEYDKAEGSEVI